MTKASAMPTDAVQIGKSPRALIAWTCGMAALVAMLASVPARHAFSQAEHPKLTLKSGESAEVEPVYWTINCRSTMIGLPEVEIMEGPPGTSLNIREEPVLPKDSRCRAKVPGGMLIVTADSITTPREGKLTYRVKYKTVDGDRQRAGVYVVSLHP